MKTELNIIEMLCRTILRRKCKHTKPITILPVTVQFANKK